MSASQAQGAKVAHRENLLAELHRIVAVLIEQYHPERIVVFGSLVSGNLHEWSDLDICIIKRTELNRAERRREVYELTQPSVSVDFFVYTPDEFEAGLREGNYFCAEEIVGGGRVLYEHGVRYPFTDAPSFHTRFPMELLQWQKEGKKKMPHRWLSYARDDLQQAELAYQNMLYPGACFHAQQVVEKCLKAFLLLNGKAPPRTHKLEKLLNDCTAFDASLTAWEAECKVLDQYYMPTRYPDEPFPSGHPPTEVEAKRALDFARQVLPSIEAKIPPPSGGSAGQDNAASSNLVTDMAQRTFRASRLTQGNVLFPDELRLEENGVVHVKRRWFGAHEDSIAYNRIALVHVSYGLLFATLRIESTGGGESIVIHGLTKGDAREAHRLIQEAQARAGGQD